MPTLGEAAAILRVSRATLDKWCQRLGIEPQRHPLDYRYFTITPEEVEHIRDTLSERPGRVIPIASKPAFDRRSWREASGTVANDATSLLPPTPAPRHAREGTVLSASQAALRDNPLPEGWIAVSTFCRRHDINLRSVERHSAMPAAIAAPDGVPWGSRSDKSAILQPVMTAYRVEDLGAAVAAAASIWPRRFSRCEDLTCPCQDTK